MEKLTDQSSVGMHDNLVGHFGGRKRVKTGVWTHRHFARIGIRRVILDQEVIDVRLLVTTNSPGNLILSIAHRKKPVESSFTMQ